MMNKFIYIYIYVYINNFFLSVGSVYQNFRTHSTTPVTADRYVIANGHYDRTCAEKPSPSHNIRVMAVWPRVA